MIRVGTPDDERSRLALCETEGIITEGENFQHTQVYSLIIENAHSLEHSSGAIDEGLFAEGKRTQFRQVYW